MRGRAGRIFGMLAAVALLAGQVLVGQLLAGPAAAAEKLKVAFVYFSPVGDTGWTAEHDKGRKWMEAALGDKVETKIVENVAFGPDSLQVIRQLAADGYGLIFTTSFGFMDQTLEVAELYPDTKFMHLDGYKTADNMGTYSLRYYESSYLAGMAAGAATKSDTIGYVSSFPLPAVIQIIDAFTLGAQATKPGVKVKVVEVNSWYDPGREKEATEALFSQGIDVVAHVTDSSAPTLAAEAAGKSVVGFHSDRTSYGPKSQLTAVIPVWGGFYTKVAESVIDGSWTNAQEWISMKDGALAIASLGAAVPKEAVEKIAKVEAEMLAGTFSPFQGPIKDQSGTERVKTGETLPDDQIYGINWYVEGVEGTLPQ